MQNLKEKNLDELKELDIPSFKAKEIFRFIHNKLGTDIDGLTTLKKEERERLKKSFYISDISLHKAQKGKGTEKVAFKLDDGKIIETVFMDYGKERKTLCVSTQVGCAMACGFCATGKMGFIRNLSTAEILSQVYYFATDHKISNIVFMGMGEPFLNYNNVSKAAKILNSKLGLNIASRKIVISTIGIIAGIRKFAEEKEQFRLAWSLAATNDKLRKKLIPFKGLPSVEQTIQALIDYQSKTKRRITIEYVVLGGENDSDQDAKELATIARRLDSHVNLIPYNPCPGSRFKGGNIKQVRSMLERSRINVTVRKSLGQEISAACGQLVSSD